MSILFTDNLFKRFETNTNRNEEKLNLGELVAKFKDEFDAEVSKNETKTKFNAKRKKHVATKPRYGYVTRAVRHFY